MVRHGRKSVLANLRAGNTEVPQPKPQVQAVVYWVNERKVSQVPLHLVSKEEQYVGAYSKIAIPGRPGEHLGLIEFIGCEYADPSPALT
jgi:hypothetical protein